jgi:hypothetical protein
MPMSAADVTARGLRSLPFLQGGMGEKLVKFAGLTLWIADFCSAIGADPDVVVESELSERKRQATEPKRTSSP